MDTLDAYRSLIRKILTEHANLRYANSPAQKITVFDSESDRYLVMVVGRENKKLVHGCLVHVDIINGKIWIQRDGTENGIANELAEAGVPKQDIVLGFKSAELRKHTEFATA